MITKNYIKDFIPPLKITDTGVRAMQWMKSFHLDHLPVVEGVKYKGILRDSDLQKVSDLNATLAELNLPYTRIFINENQYIFDALEFITKYGISIVPVLNNEGNYVGLLTLVDVIDCFAKTKSVKSPGGIIILKIKEKDYSLSEISRIVEANEGLILSSSLEETADPAEFELTLKINKLDLSRILASFFRLNFQVVASYHNSEFTNDMEDRYNAFMTYLNV